MVRNGSVALLVQAVDLLLRRCKWMMKKNEKNLEGQTALDLADGILEIEILLRNARAKRGASIPNPNHELIEPRHLTFIRRRWIAAVRGRRDLTGERREAYLVIASLIITAIYQSVLTPPGGLYPSDNWRRPLRSDLRWKEEVV
ncbi:hypothetical protein PIB30_030991 [Stylosanthes scabra]|uniref:PGG domain-containing protein n=1 Tax=Stylosanthes scabra TaxID=79078 RepID=A0ABU6UB01_9FABA|nr:hypothetical protein [Stylosanthes scabra]